MLHILPPSLKKKKVSLLPSTTISKLIVSLKIQKKKKPHTKNKQLCNSLGWRKCLQLIQLLQKKVLGGLPAAPEQGGRENQEASFIRKDQES